MLFTLSVTAQASSMVEEQYSSEVLSEYDYIEALQNSSTEDLQEVGITCEDVTDIVEEFYKSLDLRAALPNSKLEGLGYTPEEIEILRNYGRGARLSSIDFRAITGTCTGRITKNSFSTRNVQFTYSWEWDKCPIMTLTDSAAVRWLAYDVQSYTINVNKTSATATIDYYYGNSFSYSDAASFEPNLDFNSVNAQFPMIQTKYLPNIVAEIDYYAKAGRVTVSVELPYGTSNSIHNIKVAGLYGHTTLGIGAPSLGVSIPASVSISFTGNTSIDAIAGRQAVIKSSGVTYI